LHDLGYQEGRSISIESPISKGYEDLPGVTAQLVRLNVDVILATGTPATRVARKAITTIPVVFVTFADPVRTGLVASLARPGGNMTGMTMISAELAGKRLELLQETLPQVVRVAVLWNPTNRDTEEQLNETRSAARSLGIQVEPHAARAPEELDGTFAAIAKARPDAFFVLSDVMFSREPQRIATLAKREADCQGCTTGEPMSTRGA
jgi:putative ABC transport system substrate-binding protein